MGDAMPCLHAGSDHWLAIGASMCPRIWDCTRGLAAVEAAMRPAGEGGRPSFTDCMRARLWDKAVHCTMAPDIPSTSTHLPSASSKPTMKTRSTQPPPTFPEQHPLPLPDECLVPQLLHLGHQRLQVGDEGSGGGLAGEREAFDISPPFTLDTATTYSFPTFARLTTAAQRLSRASNLIFHSVVMGTGGGE